jgi:ArsR family transcriptional regulator
MNMGSQHSSGDSGSGSTAETECCSAVTHDLTEHDIELDVQMFSALANDTRYEILRLLAANDGEVCACDLVPQLEVNQSTSSRALKALYQANLVDRRKDGRWRYYTTTPRAEKLLTAIDTTREDTEGDEI